MVASRLIVPGLSFRGCDFRHARATTTGGSSERDRESRRGRATSGSHEAPRLVAFVLSSLIEWSEFARSMRLERCSVPASRCHGSGPFPLLIDL